MFIGSAETYRSMELPVPEKKYPHSDECLNSEAAMKPAWPLVSLGGGGRKTAQVKIPAQEAS